MIPCLVLRDGINGGYIMDSITWGFTIAEFRKLHNWKLLEVTNDIPFVSNIQCPSDGTTLATIATLTGNEGKQKIRVGCCCLCGYIGYIDRPHENWIKTFYADTWDRAKEKKVEDEVERWQARFKAGFDRPVNAVNVVEKLGIHLDRSRPICEIGCGHGLTLRRFAEHGFSKVIGMESSLLRVEVARRAFGLNILSSPFEVSSAQNKLRRLAPFGLIYSHHVLEHVYAPQEVIRLCSELQGEDDYMIISLPNMIGEFSLSTLLYLPHLHSFTKASLVALLARYHYQVVDYSFTTLREICLVARKRRKTEFFVAPEQVEYFNIALKKFRSYFHLGVRHFFSQRLFWCFRGIDIAGELPYWTHKPLTRLEEMVVARVFPWFYRRTISSHLGHPYEKRPPIVSLVVQDLGNRYTSFEESPLEIQFDGAVKLAYK